MAWTDERVELLKKLWSEGLSASQIAGRLGGVTRNAVIGKVHRLGLSGRATSSRSSVPRPRRNHAPKAEQSAVDHIRHARQCRSQADIRRGIRGGPCAGSCRGIGDPAARARQHPHAEGDDVQMADRRPDRGRLSFLRAQEDRLFTLLRASCPHGVSAGSGAAAGEALSQRLSLSSRP